MITKVLLPLPFNESFDYKADFPIKEGALVRVPFGREVLVGVVWGVSETSKLDDKKIKKIIEVLPFEPLKEEMRKFVEFTASYNMAFLGLVLKMVLSVKQVFDDPKMLKLYELSGKSLAEAKLKNSDAMTVTVAGNEERILLIAVYNNLGKGASGAAVECMNIVLGVDKTEGLEL